MPTSGTVGWLYIDQAILRQPKTSQTAFTYTGEFKTEESYSCHFLSGKFSAIITLDRKIFIQLSVSRLNRRCPVLRQPDLTRSEPILVFFK